MAEPVFDAEDTLVRLGDDHELFAELVESFRRDSLRGLSEIRRSVSEKDARGLALAAHTLRGVVSIFASAPAIRATQALESAGRSGVTDVASLLATLEDVITQLNTALLAYNDQVTH